MYPSMDELWAGLTDEERQWLHHSVFVIIRPDALVRGFQARLVQDFAEHGFLSVAFKYRYVDERNMEELYRFTQLRMLRNQMRPMWWMTREMYRISPALLLLIAGRHSDMFPDSATYFDHLKGPANPARTKPQDLRYRFHSMNSILCIIHSSDNAEQTLRETRIFFSKEELKAALARVPEVLAGNIPAPHRYLCHAANRWYGLTERPGSFFEVLTTLKIRILSHLIDWEVHGLPVAQLAELHSQLLGFARQRMSYVEESTAAHKVLDREAALIAEFVPRQLRSEPDWLKQAEAVDELLLFDAFQWLTDYKRFDAIDFLKFKEILRRNCVVLDNWESLVLESSFVFHKIQLEGYFIPDDKPSRQPGVRGSSDDRS